MLADQNTPLHQNRPKILSAVIRFLLCLERKILLPFKTHHRLKSYLIYGAATLCVALFLLVKYEFLPKKSGTEAAPASSPYTEDFADTDDINVIATTAQVDTVNRRVQLPTADQRISLGQQSLDDVDILWNGVEYVSVWSQITGGNEQVFFQRFDANGNPKETPKQITSSVGNTRRPAIAYASAVSRYGLVYQDNRDGDYEIFFSLLDASGNRVGLELQVSTNTNPSLAPSIAWNVTSAQFGVAWDDGPSANNDISFIRVDAVTPALVGIVGLVNTFSANKTRGETAVAWDNVNNRYGVVWHDDRTTSTEMEIYMRLLNNNGNVLGSTDTIISSASADSRDPDLIWDGDNYVIVWEEQRDGNKEIYYQVADDNLTLQLFAQAQRLTNDISVSRKPVIIAPAAPSANYGITWEDERDGNREIYFVRLNSSKTKLGTDVRVTNASGNSHTPHIAFDGTTYTILYHDFRDNVAASNGNVYLSQVLDSDGLKRTLFSRTASVESNEIDTSSSLIYRARLTATSTLATGAIISYFLSNDGGSTFEPTENGQWHVFRSSGSALRFRSILYTSNVAVTPQLNQISISYVNSSNVPVQVTLSSPSNGATSQSLTPTLQFSSTDPDSDNLRYIVQISSDATFTSRVIVYDQRVAQTGFSAQNADSNTAYISGQTVSFIIPTGVLTTGQTFYWRAWASDYNGTGELSPTIAPASGFSFTVIDDHASFTEGFFTLSKVPTLSGINDDLSDQLSIPALGLVAVSSPVNSLTTRDILWNGSNFVFTWTNDNDGDQDVYLNTISLSGVSSTAVNVSSNATLSLTPRIANNGTITGVIFEDDEGGDDIYFHLYSGALVPQIGVKMRVSESLGFSVADPDIAFNASEWATVWQDTRASNNDIFFRRITLNGNFVIGSEVNLSNSGSDSDAVPSIVWNGSEWGVVWQSAIGGGLNDILFARVDVTGAKIGSTINLTNSGGVSETNPHISWNGSFYLITWSVSGVVSAQRVSSNGQVIGSSVSLIAATTPSQGTPLIWDSISQKFVFVWDTGAASTRILTQSFSSELLPISGVIDVYSSAVASTLPYIAFANTSPSQYGVLWSRVNGSGGRDGVFQRLGADLMPDLAISSVNGVVTSNQIDTSSENILSATLTATSVVPLNTAISYELSNDGGSTFASVISGTPFTLVTTGSDLRWRATLSSLNNTVTPNLQSVSVSYGGVPYLSNQSPLSNATNINRNTNISFQINDDQSGLNTASLTLQVNGAGVIPTVTAVSAPNSYLVVYDPPTDFISSPVTVRVVVSDLSAPAKQLDTTYSFSVNTVTSLQITPSALAINKNATSTLTAMATHADSSTSNVTSNATWNSSNDAVVQVSSGSVSAVNCGSASISATYQGFSATSTVTVSGCGASTLIAPSPSPSLVSIEVIPATKVAPDADEIIFKAIAHYSDTLTKDVTTDALFSSSNESVATVAKGVVTVRSSGETIISAIYSDKTGTYLLQIQRKNLVSLLIVPSAVSLMQGESVSLAARATYDNDTVLDVTSSATWRSSDANVVSVTVGTVQALFPGEGSITASFQGFSGISEIVVIPLVRNDVGAPQIEEDAGKEEPIDVTDIPREEEIQPGQDQIFDNQSDIFQEMSQEEQEIEKITQKVSRFTSETGISISPHVVTYYLDELNRIVIVFDQRLDLISATDISNYFIDDTDKIVPSVYDKPSVQSIYYNETFSVFLSLTDLTPQSGEIFEVTISNIVSRDGAMLQPNPVIVLVSYPEREDVAEESFSKDTIFSELQAQIPNKKDTYDSSQSLQCTRKISWEAYYQFTLEKGKGSEDTDLDGLSDFEECEYGTDPRNPDTDLDSFADGEEVNDYQSNPLVAEPPSDVVRLKITNWHNFDKSVDPSPLVQGVARDGASIHIYAQNTLGEIKLLGISQPVLGNKWLVVSQLDLLDGKYKLIAQDRDQSIHILDEDAVDIEINSTLDIRKPKIMRLGQEEITPETFLKNLRVVIKDNRPYLFGKTEFGNRIVVTWQSLVFTSSLIVDSEHGSFVSAAPKKLEDGKHAIWVYALRPADRVRSQDVSLKFYVQDDFASSSTVGRFTYLVFVLATLFICMFFWYIKHVFTQKVKKSQHTFISKK